MISRGRDDGDVASPLDEAAFDSLAEIIGAEGTAEMVMIFEAETRARILRLRERGLDAATLVRELHTLKGAAGTVAAPHLTSLALHWEQSARQDGARPDLDSIAKAFEDFLSAVRARIPAGTLAEDP